MIRIDDGMNLNSSPGIDRHEPGRHLRTASKTSPILGRPVTSDNGSGVNVGTGTGVYIQNIDTTQLAEGRHYVTVRAYRHRSAVATATPVFTDFKRTIYVDRLEARCRQSSAIDPYASDPNNPNNRDLIVRSVDQTADKVHILLDLPANLTEAADPRSTSNGTNQASYYDRDQFVRGISGVTTGNHVATVVTYEPTGNFNIQRIPGLFTDTNLGAGFGDMNSSDGIYGTSDIRGTATTVRWRTYSTARTTRFGAAIRRKRGRPGRQP